MEGAVRRRVGGGIVGGAGGLGQLLDIVVRMARGCALERCAYAACGARYALHTAPLAALSC